MVLQAFPNSCSKGLNFNVMLVIIMCKNRKTGRGSVKDRMNLYSTAELKKLLEENGFFFKKKLGQNFLLNEAISQKIAASSRETMPNDFPCLAIEIGPGAGALTRQLSRLFDQVLAMEIDPHLIPVLSTTLAGADNVTIKCCDALRYPFHTLKDEYSGYAFAVCSNLPYYITSEMLMVLLEAELDIQSITVLIQTEAADRLAASPGSDEFGAISASVRYYADTEKLFRVGPGNFLPRPQVDSTVLRLTPRSEPPVHPKSKAMFFRVIRAAFSVRRKTLLNALSLSFQDKIPKDAIQNILNNCGIDPARRGETMSLEEFCRISDSFTLWENLI